MTQKVAVAILHGMGNQKEDFADDMIRLLKKRFAKHLKNKHPNPAGQLVCEPIYWAKVFDQEEEDLWQNLKTGGKMHYLRLRRFVIDYLADAVAYQPTLERHHNYDKVHRVVAAELRKLSRETGKTAPLCIIAHSLGSVVANNYFYDLQYEPEKIRETVRAEMADTPMEKGETLALFYSLGSSLALWGLRFQDYGDAIQIPAPNLASYYPNLTSGWWNMYDKDDVLGYPLKTLNHRYERAVQEDIEVNVGGWLTSWNPLSHSHYMTDSNVIKPIADKLAELWLQLNSTKE